MAVFRRESDWNLPPLNPPHPSFQEGSPKKKILDEKLATCFFNQRQFRETEKKADCSYRLNFCVS